MPRLPGYAVKSASARMKALPGGKSLLRQLQWLASRGMTASAGDAVRTSVPRNLWDSFRSQMPDLEIRQDLPAWLSSEQERQGYALELKATAAIHAAARAAPTALTWRSLGPSLITGGQTYGKWPNGDPVTVNVSGRVAAIAVDPRDSSHLLCGAAKGGIWEKRGDGPWFPRTDSLATLQTGALCFDPQNSSIAYCGTGEGNDDAISIGQGILVSKDGGTTWDFQHAGVFVGESFFDLVVDPGDSKRLFAATTGGLRISTDGTNWSEARKTKCSRNTAWSVAIAPPGGPSAEVLSACVDGLCVLQGSTWQKISLPDAPTGVDGNCFVRLAVAIAPSNPKVAYAWGAWDTLTPDNRTVRNVRLWQRDESGSWNVVPGAPATDPDSLKQADYDWCLAVSPESAFEVYCGAIELYRGNVRDGIWTNISSNGPGSSIHPDQHALVFSRDPEPTLYAGCDGGLFQSKDRGDTWQDLNEGLAITQFEYLALSPSNADWFIGGTQDNGTNLWTNSDFWQQVAEGDGGRCAVRQDQPATVFHTFYGINLWRSDSAGYAPWSSVLWIPFDYEHPASLFYPPFACSADKGDTMAAGGDSVVYVYRDGGPWVELEIPGWTAGFVSVVAIPNADELWAGTSIGGLFVAQWRGASWSLPGKLAFEKVDPPQKASEWISDILPVGDAVWVTYSSLSGGRVFYSPDRGKKWLDMTGNLPKLPVNTIQVDPNDLARIWVGLDLGVFEGRMKDQATTWTPLGSSLPNVIVGDLVFHKATRRLRAGTQSRGVWELQL